MTPYIMDLIGKLSHRKATTSRQFELLLKEIEKQPLLGKDTPLGGENRVKVEKAWSGIAVKLNKIGPPTKKPCEWRKVWTDLRSRTKKKLSENLPYIAASPNCSVDTELFLNGLSSYEKKVYKILQTPKEPPSSRNHLYNPQTSHEANELEAIIPKIEPEEFVKESDEEFVSSFGSLKPDELFDTNTLPVKPTLSASPTPDQPPKKKQHFQQQTTILKQLVVTQEKCLKVAKAQKNIATQQMAIFSAIADTMARHATAVEKQANAITEIFEIMKQRRL